jgi:putative ABC transport system ATP-binding protein
MFRERLKGLKLGLENRLLDRVGLLSGGQRQALTMMMATIVRPEVLLLDEHIAALDPKTAHQILVLTREVVENQKLATLMITHNMKHAIEFGNRLIMLHQGRIIVDIKGREKQGLSVEDLVRLFYESGGEEMVADTVLLS